jgi:hypothetical protein
VSSKTRRPRATPSYISFSTEVQSTINVVARGKLHDGSEDPLEVALYLSGNYWRVATRLQACHVNARGMLYLNVDQGLAPRPQGQCRADSNFRTPMVCATQTLEESGQASGLKWLKTGIYSGARPALGEVSAQLSYAVSFYVNSTASMFESPSPGYI